MAIVYKCGKCSKKFKVKEYAQLKTVHISDDVHEEVLDSQGRECDSCGSTIRNYDKTIEM